MLLAENRGRQLVLKHVNSWFVKKDVLFFDSLKKNNTKTLKTMYQTKVQGKQDEQKVIKADRKLLPTGVRVKRGYGRTDGRMDGCPDGCSDGCPDGCPDGRTDGREGKTRI